MCAAVAADGATAYDVLEEEIARVEEENAQLRALLQISDTHLKVTDSQQQQQSSE